MREPLVAGAELRAPGPRSQCPHGPLSFPAGDGHLARIELGLFRRRGASTVMGTDPRTWVPELAQSLAGCDTQAILLPTVTPGLLPCVLGISMATPGFLSRHSLSPIPSAQEFSTSFIS